MRTLILFIAVMVITTPAAQAQNYGQTFEQIRELNIGNPTNNRRFDRVDQIMKRKIQDRKTHVVGTLKDVIISSRGYVESIEVEFDRLHKTGSVNLDYADSGIKSSPAAYMISLYSDDEIEELYPSLLANIQTAAGGEDSFSAKKIIGATVRTDSGRTIGKVDDVLFDNSGDRARALYVKLGSRGEGVAIPFTIAKFDFSDSSKNIEISEEQAKAIDDFVRAE
ncbi:PRC-barrel domain-containing protein [Alphaproteobacteria bacterium]|nr:PRC-barrel domain-containing protein [Alphaproteobacteria bacterium]